MNRGSCVTSGVLASIVGDGLESAFLDKVWGRRLAHYRDLLPLGKDAWLTVDSFERTLATLNRAHEGWLHVADQGLRPLPSSSVDSEGMLDMGSLGAALGAGQTLYLTKAERIIPRLGDVCADLAREFAKHGVLLRR